MRKMEKSLKKWLRVSCMLLFATSISVLFTAGGANCRDKYPEKPITLLVGYAAGGAADVIARALADSADELMGQPIVVVNKPGAVSTIALADLVAAPPDGYKIMMTTQTSLCITPLFGIGKHDYKDVTPIAKIASDDVALIVGSKSPFNSISDLVSYAKKNPGKLRYGTMGMNSTPHLTMIQLEREMGIDLTHVPQKGNRPIYMGVMGGHLEAGVVAKGGAINKYNSGQVKILGILSKERDARVHNIPTYSDQNLDTTKGVWNWLEDGFWFGLVGPKDMPQTILDKWDRVLSEATKDPKLKKALATFNFSLTYSGHKKFQEKVREDGKRAAVLVQEYAQKK
jgi:tripartite-type tricarboxylate transporter receptor subunit TctC